MPLPCLRPSLSDSFVIGHVSSCQFNSHILVALVTKSCQIMQFMACRLCHSGNVIIFHDMHEIQDIYVEPFQGQGGQICLPRQKFVQNRVRVLNKNWIVRRPVVTRSNVPGMCLDQNASLSMSGMWCSRSPGRRPEMGRRPEEKKQKIGGSQTRCDKSHLVKSS